jgi:hypothetical protein
VTHYSADSVFFGKVVHNAPVAKIKFVSEVIRQVTACQLVEKKNRARNR